MHKEGVRDYGKGHKEVEKGGSRNTGKFLLCPSVDGFSQAPGFANQVPGLVQEQKWQ